jgi:molecular chaperone GrpE
MSTEENIKEEGQEVQNQENSTEETKEETTVEAVVEATPEELIQIEKDKYLRLFAEFENYKKRTSKERMELYRTAGQDIMVSLLPVLDDFDRGLAEIKKVKDKQLLKGMTLINDKFSSILTQKGLEVVAVKAGELFDGDLHEAITSIPAPTDDLKGKIIDVIEKGYKLGEKVIRFPKVVIGQA